MKNQFVFLCCAASLICAEAYSQNVVQFTTNAFPGDNYDYTAMYRADDQADRTKLRIQLGDEHSGDLEIGHNYWQTGQWFSALKFDGYGNIYSQGNIGIGTFTPFASTSNSGIHISRGTHSSILIGSPFQNYGGIVQTSDSRHRVFMGANLYDDEGQSWKSFQSGKGTAGISLLADEGTWGTGIDFITSRNDNTYAVRMHINGDGNVGIGTTSPLTAKLHINASSSAVNSLRIDEGRFSFNGNARFEVDAIGVQGGRFIIHENGNIGIGTTDPKGYKLAVAGKAVAEEVVVKLQGNWPDYVFEPEYKLPSLLEVEKFINENKHLPEVPSAEEVKEDGLSVGEMNRILLRKVEELTLYLIEQNKTHELQKEINKKLMGEIDTLKAKLSTVVKEQNLPAKISR